MEKMQLPLKKIVTLVSITLLFVYCKSPENQGTYKINTVLGDLSYIEKFGKEPEETTDRNLRISTHLAYVENLLRQKEIINLTEKQQHKRARVLDLLHQYWNEGVFPSNYEKEGQRAPCFIDDDNKICAVGYLVEHTVGRQVAEEINRTYQYSFIEDMKSITVVDWMRENALTREECAMIQPTYDFNITPVKRERIEPMKVWDGNGRHKKQNRKGQLIEKGVYENYKLIKGVKYYYDNTSGKLDRTEKYKDGELVVEKGKKE